MSKIFWISSSLADFYSCSNWTQFAFTIRIYDARTPFVGLVKKTIAFGLGSLYGWNLALYESAVYQKGDADTVRVNRVDAGSVSAGTG
jgi:hypothetical protein